MNFPDNTRLLNLCWKACRSCQDDYFYFLADTLAVPTNKLNGNSPTLGPLSLLFKGSETLLYILLLFVFFFFSLINPTINICDTSIKEEATLGWSGLQWLFNNEKSKQSGVELNGKPFSGTPSGSASPSLRCAICFIHTYIPKYYCRNMAISQWGLREGGEQHWLKSQGGGFKSWHLL